MTRHLSIGDQAVAIVGLCVVIDEALNDLSSLTEDTADVLARRLIKAATLVEYKPNAQKLSITFDLSGPAPDDPATP